MNENCYVAGWGALEFGGSSPDELNSVDVTIYDDSVCQGKKIALLNLLLIATDSLIHSLKFPF